MRTRNLIVAVTACLLLQFVFLAFAVSQVLATTVLDTNYKPVFATAGSVTGIAPMANGQIMVIGSFTSINGVARKNIARLNADGTVDTTFQIASIIQADRIDCVAVLANGKILIGGQLTYYGDTSSRNYLFRLNSDGSMDSGFDAGGYIYNSSTYGINGIVRSIAIDGEKIVVGGEFTSPKNRIVRLNANGSHDTTFDPGTGSNDTITHVARQSSGHIVIGGAFTSVNGTAKSGIARLSSAGALDTTVFGNGLTGGSLQALALQSDDKIMIGGTFSSFNGTSTPKLLRLTASGSIDSSFTQLVPSIDQQGNTTYTPAGNYFQAITSIVSLADKIVVGGWYTFTIFNGSPTEHNARIFALQKADGAFVSSVPFAGKPTDVWALAARSDGLALAGGSFTRLDNGTNANYYGLCLLSGAYLQPTESFKPVVGGQANIKTIAEQADGKRLFGGDFTIVANTSKQGVARLNADGTLDTSFSVSEIVGGAVNAVLTRPDGKMVVGGSFYALGGQNNIDVALINGSGAVEASAYLGGVNAMAWYPGGKIVAALPHAPGIRRLNADLTPDGSFTPGDIITNNQQPDYEFDRVNAVAVQADGKMLLGGSFSTAGGVARQNIVRLNADGSVDATFTSPAFTVFNARNEVFGIAVQADGKMLLAGRFSTVGGVARPTLVRLNTDGSVDSSFITPFTDAGTTAYAVAVLADGRILVGGNMQIVEGAAMYNSLVRLNPNGSRDSSFNQSVSGNVATIHENSGVLLAGGAIETVDSAPRMAVARFQTTAEYMLTVNRSGSGAVTTVSGIIGWSGDTGMRFFDAGSTIELAAVASNGYIFNGWNGEGCSGTGACSVAMLAARNVTATFVPGVYSLSVTIAGSGGGTVASSPAGIACTTGTCSANFNSGTTVTLSATPNAASTFYGWTTDCSGSGNCIASMTGNRNATANFNLIPKAMINSTPYGSLTSAYTAATAGVTIKARNQEFTENLTLNRGIAFTLQGGYADGYDSRPGYTTLDGLLTIGTGRLTVDRLVVQ